jgi:hypothetical protein
MRLKMFEYTILMDLRSAIVSMPLGGLGNQLFNLCASWVTAKQKGCPLYILSLADGKNKHNHKKRNYTELVFKHFGTPLPFTFESQEFRTLVAVNSLKFYKPPTGFHPWNPDHVQPGTAMDTYFQFYPPLAEFESDLRSLLKQSLAVFSDVLKTRDFSQCAFLHIRRGDYLDIPHLHFIQPLSYYETAVNQLLSKNQSVEKILVFCEDMEWVRQQSFFSSPLFELYECDDELTTLAVMGACKAGAICANSTFSWWGAFLGAYEDRNPVFVPQRWINEHVVSLFPDEWFVLDTDGKILNDKLPEPDLFQNKKIALILSCKKEPYYSKFCSKNDVWKTLESKGFVVVRLYSDPRITEAIVTHDSNPGYILTVPFIEHYDFLSIKMELAYQYFSTKQVQGILKIDDDIHIHKWDLFEHEFIPTLPNYDYVGVAEAIFGFKTSSGYWQVRPNKKNGLHMLSNSITRVGKQITYFAGPFYWISKNAINVICESGLRTVYEDVSVGQALMKSIESSTLTKRWYKEMYPTVISWDQD